MISQTGKVYGKKFLIISTSSEVSDSLERVLLFAGASVAVATDPVSGLDLFQTEKPDLVIIFDPSNVFNLKHLHISLVSNKISKSSHRLIITNQFIIDELRDNLRDENTDLIPTAEFDIVHAVFRIEEIIKDDKAQKNEELIDISEVKPNKVFDPKTLTVRVFVVEDDMLMRDLLTTKFKNAGFEFNLFPSGEGAIEAILQFKPEVVVLDYTLPKKNGLDVLRDIRSKSDLEGVEVIIFSNRDEESDKAAARSLGVNKFLLKVATDLNDLVEIIKSSVR